MPLFEISADEVNEIFSQLRRDLLFCAVGKMEADMVFEHFSHEAVHTASDGGQKHKLVATIAARGERALNGVHLAAELAHALDHFDDFPFLRHEHSPLNDTLPGYSMYGMGV
jgi:hypothetical protein